MRNIRRDRIGSESLLPSNGNTYQPPVAGELLGPEDDEWIRIAEVKLRLLCTRRRLLDIYNKPSGCLVLEKEGLEKAWRPTSQAKDMLRGFQLADIVLFKEAPQSAEQGQR